MDSGRGADSPPAQPAVLAPCPQHSAPGSARPPSEVASASGRLAPADWLLPSGAALHHSAESWKGHPEPRPVTPSVDLGAHTGPCGGDGGSCDRRPTLELGEFTSLTHSGVCGGLKETRVLWMGGVDAARASRAVLRAQDPRRAGHRARRPRPAPLEPGWAGGERRVQGPQGRGAGRAPQGGEPCGGEVAGAGGGARSRTWTTPCARTREALPAHGLVGGGARPNVVVATKLPEAPAAARAPQAGAESPTRGRGGRGRPRVLATASGARLTRPLAQRLPPSKRILRSRPPGRVKRPSRMGTAFPRTGRC